MACEDVNVDNLSTPNLFTYLKCGAIEIQKLKEKVAGLAAANGIGNFDPLVLRHYVETAQEYTQAGGNLQLDFGLGTYGYVTLSQNVTSLTFNAENAPAVNRVSQMTLEIVQGTGGSKTITWPTSFKWAGGAAPVLSTTEGARDIVNFYTRDGGVTYFGFYLAKGIL